MRHGLSVIQGDADRDLDAYPNAAFDVVVLSQTLQATREPRLVLEELVRIGKRAIVSFPNFGFWRVRLSLLLRGRMPVIRTARHIPGTTRRTSISARSATLSRCATNSALRIERSLTLDRHGRPFTLDPRGSLANLLAEQGVFVLSGAR